MPQRLPVQQSRYRSEMWQRTATHPREVRNPQPKNVVQIVRRGLGIGALFGLALSIFSACAGARAPAEPPAPEAQVPTEPPVSEPAGAAERPPGARPAAPAPPVTDPEGWRRIEGSGPYTVALPQALIDRANRPTGIDTRLFHIETPSLEIRFIYGRHLGGEPPSEPGIVHVVQDSVEIDGEAGVITRYHFAPSPDRPFPYRARLFVQPPDPDIVWLPRRLVIYARCRGPEDCALAERIMRTVRFNREPPP